MFSAALKMFAQGFAGTLQEAVFDDGVIGTRRKCNGYASHAFSS